MLARPPSQPPVQRNSAPPMYSPTIPITDPATAASAKIIGHSIRSPRFLITALSRNCANPATAASTSTRRVGWLSIICWIVARGRIHIENQGFNVVPVVVSVMIQYSLPGLSSGTQTYHNHTMDRP